MVDGGSITLGDRARFGTLGQKFFLRAKACAFGFSAAGAESVIGVVFATADEARNETQAVDSLFG
jgi:hypothetical protein